MKSETTSDGFVHEDHSPPITLWLVYKEKRILKNETTQDPKNIQPLCISSLSWSLSLSLLKLGAPVKKTMTSSLTLSPNWKPEDFCLIKTPALSHSTCLSRALKISPLVDLLDESKCLPHLCYQTSSFYNLQASSLYQVGSLSHNLHLDSSLRTSL